MADSEIEWSQGAGRSRTLSEHLLCARLCNWHYTRHLIYSIYCYSKLFAIFFPLYRWENRGGYPGSEWQKQVSDLRHPPTRTHKTSSQWVANSTARSPAWGSRGRDHPCRPQQSGSAARRSWPWSWILKDEEKRSRNQREEKFPKQRQREKSTEKKCFRRMTVPVADNILCDSTLPSQPNLPAPWHRTLAASNSDYPLCLHVPSSIYLASSS